MAESRNTTERSRDNRNTERGSRTGSASSRKTGTSKNSRGSAKRSSSRNTRSKKTNYASNQQFSEIIACVIIAFALLLFLSNFGIIGKVGNVLSAIQFGTFGVVAYVFPIILALAILLLVVNNNSGVARVKVLAICIGVVGISTFFELISDRYSSMDKLSAYYSFDELVKKGGGIIGGALCKLLTPGFGKIGAYIITIVLIIIAIVLITERSLLKGTMNTIRRFFGSARDDINEYREETGKRREVREEALREREYQREQERLAKAEERKKRYDTKLTGVNLNLEIPKEDAGFDTRVTDEIASESVNNIKTAKADKKTKQTSATELFRSEKYSENIIEISPDENISSVKYKESASTIPEIVVNKPEHEAPPVHKGSIFDGVNSTLLGSASEVFSPYEQAGNDDAHNQEATVNNNSYDTGSYSEAPVEEPVPVMTPDYSAPVTKPSKAEEAMAKQQAENEILAQVEASNELTEEIKKEYKFPPVSLLNKMKAGAQTSEKELNETALKLQQTLSSFGVKVTVNNYSRGPAVTRYEITPEVGVKVSRIVSLADDIKLNLAAADIRIEAPIPGKAAVGIEVPNSENSGVSFRELIESKEFQDAKSNLAVGIGKDIGGQVIVTDIAKMPHVLIAGSTGSGKSVCINTIIMSILYRAKPDDVKLIMVDPKVVELSVYNGIPHLMIPVVTDPKKAAAALNWAVAEMDDRYQKFAKCGVRDLKGYNERVETVLKEPAVEGEERPNKLPQIVIIIDELADLMMVAKGEVEDAIVRLAQLARACGIHLVIATQRPSVDVITGLIKANVPSRIAFAVSSGVDSRTILDMTGAEKLLGKGDMLFAPAGYPKPARVQGAFVSDGEVSKVVDFLKENCNGEVVYTQDITSPMYSSPAMAESQAFGGDKDEYFAEAGRFLIDKGKGSIGMLQRVYKIGFNRAARIMDQLEDAGVVGPEEGTKPRKILLTLEEFEDLLNS